MYNFTSGELDQLLGSVREALNDACCLGCWVDSLEYDVKNYIGEKPFIAFRGYSESMLQHLNFIRQILLSKDFDLLL